MLVELSRSSTAIFDFPIRSRGDLTGVGNGVADPLQGLYILGSLRWEADQMIVHFLLDCGATASFIT